jgi:hypothetical protein
MDGKRLLNGLCCQKRRDFAKFSFSRYTNAMSLVSFKSSPKSEFDSMLQVLVTSIRQTENFNKISYIIDEF